MNKIVLNLDESLGVRNVEIEACGAITRSDGVIEEICESRQKAAMPGAVYGNVVTFWNAMEPVFNNLMVEENTNLYPVE
jgi:hypothetical protein